MQHSSASWYESITRVANSRPIYTREREITERVNRLPECVPVTFLVQLQSTGKDITLPVMLPARFEATNNKSALPVMFLATQN